MVGGRSTVAKNTGTMTTEVPYTSVEDIKRAGILLAQLVREGVTFTSHYNNGTLIIIYTGGF